MSEPILQPPAPIKQAIGLIWASFAVTVLSWISLFFMDAPDYLKRVLGQVGMPLNTFLAIKIFTLCIWAGVIYFLLGKVAKGRNWARILFLIDGIITLPDEAYRFLSYKDLAGQAENLVWNLPALGFTYYALYLLYSAPGKDWFKKPQPTALS